MKPDPNQVSPDAGSRLSIDAAESYDGRAVTLTVEGELDCVSAAELRAAVEVVLADVVELNLAAVTFLDSSGIRCLLTCRRLATDRGSRLALLDPSPQVVSVLEITGLLETFDLSGDAPSSIGHLRRHCDTHPDPILAEPTADLLARSAGLRQAARETKERAQAARARRSYPPVSRPDVTPKGERPR